MMYIRPMESGYCPVGDVLKKTWESSISQLVAGKLYSVAEIASIRKTMEATKKAFYQHKNTCRVCKNVAEPPTHKTER